MEPAQAKPIRRRRRWLIGTFLLVLAALSTWWYWPRGDARFVGKWRVTYDSNPNHYFLELRSNGLVRSEDPRSGRVGWGTWQVRDGALICGHVPDTLAWKLSTTLSKWLSSRTVQIGGDSEMTRQIADVQPDKILLTGMILKGAGGKQWTQRNRRTLLTRIPE